MSEYIVMTAPDPGNKCVDCIFRITPKPARHLASCGNRHNMPRCNRSGDGRSTRYVLAHKLALVPLTHDDAATLVWNARWE